MGGLSGIRPGAVTELAFNHKRLFPGLSSSNHRVTSPEDGDYNCVAWAIGLTDDWTQPGDTDDVAGARPYYLDWALEILAAAGLERTAILPAQGEALAVFATDDQFTHVARRLPNGRWTSKLGDWEDIEHADLECLEGGAYGFVVAMMAREAVP